MTEVPEAVRRWRACIPWDNAQIEIALREEAAVQPTEFMRNRYLQRADGLARGYLRQATVNAVLGRLVKVCVVCGASALYRIGYTGRCRQHRMVGLAEARKNVTARGDALAVQRDKVDRELRLRDVGKQRARRGSTRNRGGVERSS